MRDNALVSRELFGASEESPDTYLCVLPLSHSFGQTVVQNSATAFGGTLVMLPRFEAVAALELMQREEITFFAGVPTMYWGLLGALESVSAMGEVDVKHVADNLRVAVSGGSALPMEVVPRVRGQVRGRHHRGIRTLRDVAGRTPQAVRRRGAPRLNRRGHPGGGDGTDHPRRLGSDRVDVRGHRRDRHLSDIRGRDRKLSRRIALHAFNAQPDKGEFMYAGIRYGSRISPDW